MGIPTSLVLKCIPHKSEKDIKTPGTRSSLASFVLGIWYRCIVRVSLRFGATGTLVQQLIWVSTCTLVNVSRRNAAPLGLPFALEVRPSCQLGRWQCFLKTSVSVCRPLVAKVFWYSNFPALPSLLHFIQSAVFAGRQ